MVKRNRDEAHDFTMNDDEDEMDMDNDNDNDDGGMAPKKIKAYLMKPAEKLFLAEKAETSSIYRVAKDFNVSCAAVKRYKRRAQLGELGEEAAEPTLPTWATAGMPENPFGDDESTNLKGKKLTDVERTYLAALINIERVPCKSVSEKYGLPTSTLYSYALNKRGGQPDQKPRKPKGTYNTSGEKHHGGIPKAIDDTGMEELRRLKEAGAASRSAMRPYLLEQVAATKGRRLGAPAMEEDKKLAGPQIVKYFKALGM